MIKNNKYSQKKAQGYSADLIIVVAIALFAALFLVFAKIDGTKKIDLKEVQKESEFESKQIYDNLKTNDIVKENNEIDVEKLLQMESNELREELGIKGEFAIVFEKEGKLVKIDPENDINCIGSSKIIVNSQACS